MQPVQGEYARFFGQSSSPGVPVLAQSVRRSAQQPPEAEASSTSNVAPQHSSAAASLPDRPSIAAADGGGKPATEGTLGEQRADREAGLSKAPERLPSAALHFEGCLGDVLSVHVDVVSILPRAVPLQQATLVMAIMQVRGLSVSLFVYFCWGGLVAAMSKLLAHSSSALEKQEMIWRWRPDVVGKLLILPLQETSTPSSVVTSPSGTGRTGSPFQASLDGRAPLEGRLRSTPRMYKAYSEYASTPRSQQKAVAWQEVEELECPLAAAQVPTLALPADSTAGRMTALCLCTIS